MISHYKPVAKQCYKRVHHGHTMVKNTLLQDILPGFQIVSTAIVLAVSVQTWGVSAAEAVPTKEPDLNEARKLLLNEETWTLYPIAQAKLGPGKDQAEWCELAALASMARCINSTVIPPAERAVKLAPNNAHILGTYALTLKDSPAYLKAVSIARSAVALAPRDGRAHAILATTLVRTGKNDEARKELALAIKLSPSDLDTEIICGKSYEELFDEDEARACYNRLVKDNPDIPRAWAKRALFRMRFDDPEGAVSDWSKAIALHPAMPLYAERAGLLKNLHRNAEAASDYTYMIKHGADYDGTLGRATAYLDAKEYDKAVEDFTHCIEAMTVAKQKGAWAMNAACPSDAYYFDLWSRKLDALSKGGRDAQTVDVATLILKHHPETVKVRNMRQQSLIKLKRYAEALADLNILIPIDPQIREWHVAKAEALQALGKTSEAAREKQKAKEIEKTGF